VIIQTLRPLTAPTVGRPAARRSVASAYESYARTKLEPKDGDDLGFVGQKGGPRLNYELELVLRRAAPRTPSSSPANADEQCVAATPRKRCSVNSAASSSPRRRGTTIPPPCRAGDQMISVG